MSSINYGNTVIWMRILDARNLYSGMSGSTYFKVLLKGHARILYETKPWNRGTGMPYWNEEFNFVSSHPQKDIIIIKVYDLDIHGHHHLLGKARIPVLEYLGRGMVDQWYVLTPRRRHEARGALGDVHVQFMCGGMPASYGFLAEPTSLPTLQTTTVWVPAAIPYVPVSTSTVQTATTTIPPAPSLPQMPHSGHTSVPTHSAFGPKIEPITTTGATTTTFYTPAAAVAQPGYIPRSH